MAIGYEDVPHGTYDEWKANTIGKEYDLDGYYGCQCWDYASLFWRNVGFGVGYPLTGSLQYAYECWTVNRNVNAGETFDLIYNKSEIKRGDVIVMNASDFNVAGHITFADEDYNGTDYIRCVGQNQGGTPSPEGGTPVTENVLGLDAFLGCFRYKGWHTTPPTPPIGSFKKHFKWVLYANKLRAKH